MNEYEEIPWMTVTKARAERWGLMFYFESKPCSEGHISPRFVKDDQCIECHWPELYDFLLERQLKYNSLSREEKNSRSNLKRAKDLWPDVTRWTISRIKTSYDLRKLMKPRVNLDKPLLPGWDQFLKTVKRNKPRIRYYGQVVVDGKKLILDDGGGGFTSLTRALTAIDKFNKEQ